MTLRLFDNDNQVAQLTARTKRRYVSYLKPKRDLENGTLCHFRGVRGDDMSTKESARRTGATWLHRNNVATRQWQNPQSAELTTGSRPTNPAPRRVGISAALPVRPRCSFRKAPLKPRIQRSNVDI